MNDDRVFERAVDDWLADGSDRTPESTLDAVLLAVKTTPQERDLRVPWRTPKMSTQLRLAVAIALVAIAGVAVVLIGGGGPNNGPTTSPSPSVAPTPTAIATLGTTQWIAYTSERYGVDVKRPPNWTESPAESNWKLAEASLFPQPGTEDFAYQPAEDMGVRVSLWSDAVAPGTSLDTWLQAYCSAGGVPCPGALDAARTSPSTATLRSRSPGRTRTRGCLP